MTGCIAGRENPAKNGKRVADILKANGTPVKYHVMEGIAHYGIYREKFQEVTAMEVEWFDRYLKQAVEP
ncbi:MAG: hypothetical protein VCG02_13090 [Verrucomicrobiota bacterium]